MSSLEIQIQRVLAEKAELEEWIIELEKEIEENENRQDLMPRPFCIQQPGFWFSIAEAQFQSTGITDDQTKYIYLVSQLDKETIEKVKDIISNPPIEGKYLKLKEELTKRLQVPEHKRIRQLFDEKINDRTPSQFYHHLKWLAGPNVTVDKMLLHLWLRQLPTHFQEILASQMDLSDTKLAELADDIVEASGPSEIDAAHDAVEDNIQEKVNELVKQVAALEGTVKAWSQSKFFQGRSGHTKVKTLEKICWYHRRWGSKALKCIPPCGWKKDEPEKE